MGKERLVWIDMLNITACASVLLLHSTNEEVLHFSAISMDWYIGLITHSFFFWPVNAFFMISGYTLVENYLLTNNNNWGG